MKVTIKHKYLITLFSDQILIHEKVLEPEDYSRFMQGFYKSIVRVTDLHELTKNGFKPIEKY